jgi:hypothetical protein
VVGSDAGEEDHVEAGRGDERGGAEIRLARDEQHRHRDQQRAQHEVAQVDRRFLAMEIPGEHQRQGQLHHLGRLEARHADVQPAPRAVYHVAEEGDRDQEGEAHDVGGHGEAHQRLRRDLRRDPHRGERHDKVHKLVQHPHRALVRGGVERRQPEYRQREDDQQQRLVDSLRKPDPDATQREAGLESHQSLSLSSSTSSSVCGSTSPFGALPRRK